jgi:uncharacterized protein (DUF885 family)
METPGPYETRATDAYYYVTPTEPDWTPAQKDEWLTAFNYYTTDVVSIHEAYPGHYVQFLGLNASKASRVAKVVTSYSFVEGWGALHGADGVGRWIWGPWNTGPSSHGEIPDGAI